MDSVDYAYFYNYQDGLWQTGQPVSTVRFEHIRGTAMGAIFYVIGDSSRTFELSVTHIRFSCIPLQQDDNR